MKLSKFRTADLIFKSKSSSSLDKFETEITPLYKDDDNAEKEINDFREELRNYQERLYAESKQALLVVIQGMDTSGKDGLVEHLLTGINPQGVHVISFKQPSQEELSHDFLWRSACNIPRRGMIGIFNRSYYEDVIVSRVHPEFMPAQRLPLKIEKSKDLWEIRFKSIVNFEDYLSSQGWTIVKIFLHISHKEQKKRLLKRIEDQEKHWKFDANDLTEREFWKAYQKYYAECFSKTSTKQTPWHIIPSDDKKNARLITSKLILEALKKMSPDFPETSPKDLKIIRDSKKELLND